MVKSNQAIIAKSEELTKTQRQKWKETYQSQFADIIEYEVELQKNWGLGRQKTASMRPMQFYTSKATKVSTRGG
jgi:hypothetical protein